MWFLSPRLRDEFCAIAGIEPMRVKSNIGPMPIERPIQLDRCRAALRRDLGLDRFTVLFLGRLVRVKGAAELLSALADLPEPPSVRIAGDGPERGALRALAQRLGIDVRFEGWVSGERKEALLRACDALVLPSRPDDGLPTVLFEAKARGLPIIATELSAIPSRLRDDPGVALVPTNDGAALGRAIACAQAQAELGAAVRA
jgi:glycosyltransferase involved in cell wall biosynthesis